jgi:hypothetical protein
LDIDGRILAIRLPTTAQQKSEKGQINGYAPLDTIGVVPLVHLPDALVDATELSAAIAAHAAAADPHTGYQKESEKGSPNGYASLDSLGVIPDSQLPASFFTWASLANGFVATTKTVVYTVPTGKRANVCFFSLTNTSAITQTLEVFIKRFGQPSTPVGTTELLELEYAWYVDWSDAQWMLSEGDSIEAMTTTGTTVSFIILGAEKDA